MPKTQGRGNRGLTPNGLRHNTDTLTAHQINPRAMPPSTRIDWQVT